MEDDVKLEEGPIQETVETRLVRLEGRVVDIAAEVGEVTSDVRDLRGGGGDDSRAMRKEMRDGDHALRGATDERFRALYKEMRERDLSLREEMYESLRSIRKQLSDQELSNMNIWALLIAAALLGTLARGFHWI